MIEQLQLLLELQEFDLRSDEIQGSKRSLDEHLDDAEQALAQLNADLDMQREELEATEQLHRDKKEEYDQVQDRFKKSKARLSKVSSTKEYAAIELEIENAKRQASLLEDELLQLMEAIETSRGVLDEKAEKIAALSTEVKKERERASGRGKELELEVGKLTKKRDTLLDRIESKILRRYDFIRSRRDGYALVAAIEGCCQGCFMQLPPQLYIELQRADSFKTCPSCQRILYHEQIEASPR